MTEPTSIAAPSASPCLDPGVVARAAERALEAVGAEGRSVPRGVMGSGDLSQLARSLESEAPVVARVRHLRAEELSTLGAGLAALVPTASGWVVVGAGRCAFVGSNGERESAPSPRVLRRLLSQGRGERTEAVVLEPRLALQRLTRGALGSASAWARLWALLRLDATDLVALALYAVVLGGLSLAVPIAVQVLVNTIAFGSLLQPLVVLAALLLGVLLLSGLVQVVEAYAIEVLQRRFFVRVAEDFARRLSSVPVHAHEQRDVAELSNRFFEVVTLQKTLDKLLFDGLGLVLQTLAGLVLLAFYHPILLVFDAVLIVALLVVVLLGHGAISTAVDESNAKYRVAAWLQTLASKPELFLRSSAARHGAIRADVLTRQYIGLRRRHYARVFRQLIGGVGVQGGAIVALLGVGGYLVMQRELTLGQLVAAELVVGSVGAGYSKLGKIFESVYDLLASLDKVGKVLDLPAEDTSALAEAPEAGQRIELSAACATSEGPSISATLTPGVRLWLEGHADVSRPFLEVLTGLRSPHSGSVRMLDGEATPLAPGALRGGTWLLTAAPLITGRILDNLRVAKPELSESEAWGALRQVGLAARVAQLPEGLETPLTERSGALSPAQRMRLALAQAWLARPALLAVDGALRVLDEADAKNRDLLQGLLSPQAPWALVVAGGPAALRARCTHALDLTARSPTVAPIASGGGTFPLEDR